ncbi:MAG: elongation factor P-like protein YeiP [Verrucomicrobia bacterium]|nr:elongation factor P-like protein YeiP [Verrucomicrobiota bacterium]
MPKAAELKRGAIVNLNGTPHVVETLHVQSPSARGGSSLYKIRFRNLVNKQKDDRTFKGEDVLAPIDFERRDVQFSYAQGDTYNFMDLADYSEFSLNANELEHERDYLFEGMEEITALVSDGRVLAIELPDVVELEITQCDPSVRGASVTARTKPATCSTGVVVQVPEYLAQGEVIRIDTRENKFLSRA